MAIKKSTTATKNKTFQEYINKHGLGTDATKLREFMVGKKFRILNNVNSHNYGPVGTIITVQPTANIGVGSANGLIPGGNGIVYTSIQLVLPVTIEELLEEKQFLINDLENLNQQIVNIDIKISFIKENGIEEFDEDAYKVYTTLQVLKTKKTDIEKAQIIAQLIKG